MVVTVENAERKKHLSYVAQNGGQYLPFPCPPSPRSLYSSVAEITIQSAASLAAAATEASNCLAR